MMLHALGLRLGKTLSELGDMPVDEFQSWVAFLHILDDENK